MIKICIWVMEIFHWEDLLWAYSKEFGKCWYGPCPMELKKFEIGIALKNCARFYVSDDRVGGTRGFSHGNFVNVVLQLIMHCRHWCATTTIMDGLGWVILSLNLLTVSLICDHLIIACLATILRRIVVNYESLIKGFI